MADSLLVPALRRRGGRAPLDGPGAARARRIRTGRYFLAGSLPAGEEAPRSRRAPLRRPGGHGGGSLTFREQLNTRPRGLDRGRACRVLGTAAAARQVDGCRVLGTCGAPAQCQALRPYPVARWPVPDHRGLALASVVDGEGAVERGARGHGREQRAARRAAGAPVRAVGRGPLPC